MLVKFYRNSSVHLVMNSRVASAQIMGMDEDHIINRTQPIIITFLHIMVDGNVFISS